MSAVSCDCVTMTETDVDADAESGEQGNDAGRNQDNHGCQATSMMSRISGVRRNRTPSNSSVSKLDAEPPTFGVNDVPDSILVEVPTAISLSGLQAPRQTDIRQQNIDKKALSDNLSERDVRGSSRTASTDLCLDRFC